MASAAPSDRVGPWVVLRRIAVGGMAEIFEARAADAPEGAPTVVLKVLLPQHARDPEFVRMLADEARVHAALEHPNLVRLLGHGLAGDHPWLALERVDGPSVDELVASLARASGTMPHGVALFVGAELLRALEYVHAAKDASGLALGIVHRDVTPQNVLVDRAGCVRLGDFGIARSAARDARTRTGVIKGKLRYLAPEQVTLSTVDARADLYSAAVLLWELLAGEPYLQGDGDVQLLRAAESPTYRPLAAMGIDERLDRILGRALSRFPEERWSSARAFLDAVEKLRDEPNLRAGAPELAALVEQTRESERPAAARAVAAVSREPAASSSNAASAADAASVPAAKQRSSLVGALATVGVVTLVLGAAWQLGAFGPAAPVLDAERAGFAAADAAPAVLVAPVDRTDAAAALDASAPAADAGHDGGAAARSVGRTPDVPRRHDADVAAPRAPDAGSAPSPAHAALVARATALRTDLRARGILVADLSAPVRGELRALDAALEAHHDADAERALASLEPTLSAVVVDAAFVRAKLDRVNAAMRAARTAGRDVAPLESVSGTALQEYLDGRYDSTNRRLNEILRQLQ